VAIQIKPKPVLGATNQAAPLVGAVNQSIQPTFQGPDTSVTATPTPVPKVSAKDRVDAGVQFGQEWVNGKVPDGVLGRRTDSYRDGVDSLIKTQNDNLAGYDSPLMQEAARSQAQALAGGAKAFGGKIGGGAAGAAMAPFAQNAAMQYQSGLTADNFDAKTRALQAAADYLPKAASEELSIDQDNQGLTQKEHTLRATLPFDIAQLLEGTRNGILGNQDADWLLDLVKGVRGRTNTLTGEIDKAQGR
jgi:hypothetical protein